MAPNILKLKSAYCHPLRYYDTDERIRKEKEKDPVLDVKLWCILTIIWNDLGCIWVKDFAYLCVQFINYYAFLLKYFFQTMYLVMFSSPPILPRYSTPSHSPNCMLLLSFFQKTNNKPSGGGTHL